MKDICRRQLLTRGIGAASAALAWPVLVHGRPADLSFRHEARWYERLDDGRVRCLLCPNACVRDTGERSRCRAREPKGGKLYSLVYGLPCVIMLDHVAKCPLYHVELPGKVFSIATAGCNLGCDYCQNWQFSQSGPDETKNFRLTPQQVVDKAVEKGCPGIAFFYTEPTVYYEYMWDIAGLARKRGLKTIVVTAGYFNDGPLRELAGRVDMFTVGLKGFDDGFYRRTIHGELAPVLKTLTTLHEVGVWFEVVNLILPGLNDSPDGLRAMCSWLVRNLGPDRPLHFTRFRPQYKLRQLPLTPVKTLEAARSMALEAGLRYVYIGNLPGHEGNHTYCPKCGTTLISRLGFEVVERKLRDGACPDCGQRLPGPC